MTTETLTWLIPLPPLLAFFLIILVINRSKALSHATALIGAFLSWAMAMIVFARAVTTDGLAETPILSSVNWIPTADTWLRIGVLVDPLSAITLFFVGWTCSRQHRPSQQP